MKILFVCNQNKNRSKTAEEIFKGSFQTSSAGLYNDTPINKNQMLSADIIIVMEDIQRNELAKRFPKLYLQKRILSLEISDIYQFMQPELLSILNTQFDDLVKPFIELTLN